MATDATTPRSPAAANSTPLPDTSALPDDLVVLKQMIAELLRALRGERRDHEETRQRLDALLKRLYGPRPQPVDPHQMLLFAADDAVPTPPPPAPPSVSDTEKPRRGQTNKPHGRA